MQSIYKKYKQIRRKAKMWWGQSLAATAIVIVLMLLASLLVIYNINTMEEDRALKQLYGDSNDVVETIVSCADNDRASLEILSGTVAQFGDLTDPALWELLDSYVNVGMMSHVELLLPGDTVLTTGGQAIDASGKLSFQAEAAKGEHISDRETDLVNENLFVVRHYMPVKRNGETVAMLYGVVITDNLVETAGLHPYEGKAAVYVIDGNTGDFLLDTWHPGAGGNIWELGERKMAPGYTKEQMYEGFVTGRSGHVVFVSRTIGEYLYFYSQPLPINNWRIGLSVPESVVFRNANAIKHRLNVFIAFEIICFAVYFVWMSAYVRRATAEKQKRIDMIEDISHIERMLFNAHEEEQSLYNAMEKLRSLTGADRVALWVWGSTGGRKFLCMEGMELCEQRANGCQFGFIRLLEHFATGNRFFESSIYPSIRLMVPQKEFIDVESVIAVPVKGNNGMICGILALGNIESDATMKILLQSMTFSFGRFRENLHTHVVIQEQRDRDALTGLYNRMRYERDIREHFADPNISKACVYIDVNGLHAVNNTQGHKAGDIMLCIIADGMRKYFDTSYIYRIGGDEFVLLFSGSREESELAAQSAALQEELDKKNYHISVGVCCGEEGELIDDLLKRAEHEMYLEKAEYYKTHDRRR